MTSSPHERDLSLKSLGYDFRDPRLLRTALTHPSYTQIHPDTESNQRLEFLGDAILSAILAEMLYRKFPNEREGVLSHYRAALAKGRHLARRARELHLEEVLLLGEGELRDASGQLRPSILEDAYEAIVGAIYLDGGWEAVRTLLVAQFADIEQSLFELTESHNPKGRLQERFQPLHGNGAVVYELVSEEGPPHQRKYTARVFVNGEMRGEGTGSSKKTAEEEAAAAALRAEDTP